MYYNNTPWNTIAILVDANSNIKVIDANHTRLEETEFKK